MSSLLLLWLLLSPRFVFRFAQAALLGCGSVDGFEVELAFIEGALGFDASRFGVGDLLCAVASSCFFSVSLSLG